MNDNTINADVTMGGATGTLLAGRYRVVRQLGQGGMGSVWLAEDTKLDGFNVAIKMLPSVLVNNKRAYQQVKQEALVSLKLSHPNIATVRAFEEEGGNPFLVMDYIDGQTLDDYLAEKGKLTEDEVVKLLKPVAAALDYAHVQGVVHRDVKPGNVMIRKDGTPFVLDFGIAREIQETMTRVTGKLSSGTLMYMSPEQLNGDAPKPAQDIYSFAAMAYECLKGEPPFSRGGIEDQIKHKTPEPLGPQFIKCGHGVMAGLAKSSEDRPGCCAAVLEKGGKRAAKADAGASASKTRIAAMGAMLALAALVGGASWILKTQKGTKALYGAGPTVDDPVVVTQVVEKVVEKPNSVTYETADSEVEREDLLVERTAVRSDSAKLDLATRGTGSQKVIVGVMTSLKGVVGEPTGMQKGPSSSKGWVAFTELAKNYEVKSVATDVMKIDANIKVLVVLHAKDLPEKTLYAIDQFVLRGGNLIACVDPFSVKDIIASRQQQNQRQGQMSGIDGPSTLDRLFDSWGVKFDTTKVASDLQAATKLNNGQGGIDDNPAFLSLGTNNMVRNDILVTRLSNIMFPFAGAFEFDVKTGRSLVLTPVLTTSKEHSCSIDKTAIILGGSVENTIPDGHEHILVARLSGTFKTAFPNAMDGGDDAGKPIVEGVSHVILCADSDFLADEFCVRMMKTPFGEIPQLINDNLTFFSNMIDRFAGRENRTVVRSVGASDHSLGDVNEAEAKAMEAWQRLQTEYEDELEKTQQRLAALQKQKGDNDRLVLSREQQDEILRFRKVQDEIRKKQKDVVTKLHEDETERQHAPKIGDTKTITLPGGATMEMVWCPATTSAEWKKISGGKDYFLMGSSDAEKFRGAHEKLHCVTLTDGFWIGRYEVTQGQWKSVMGENPSWFKGDNRPVEQVSWEDCQGFVRKVNAMTSVAVSLPTEAQWEYACRAGTLTPYNFDETLDDDKIDWNYPYGTQTRDRYHRQTAPAGSFVPNAWGIYDMHCNVREWCLDWYMDYSGDAINPTGPASGDGRVFRGGCWSYYTQIVRSAHRGRYKPDFRKNDLGFRVVCCPFNKDLSDCYSLIGDVAELASHNEFPNNDLARHSSALPVVVSDTTELEKMLSEEKRRVRAKIASERTEMDKDRGGELDRLRTLLKQRIRDDGQRKNN